MLSAEIRNIIQSLWDRLWAGGQSNPISAIEQISFLIFMKRLENFIPNIEEQYRWSYYTNQIEGEELVTHIKETVFKFIKNNLAEDTEPFAKAMKDATFKINKSVLLKDAIDYIDSIYEEIQKEESEHQYFQDIQGDVYEHLLKHTSEAGKNGQFRTPRHIIQMMAELLDPDLDGKICDLASGSAGFLVGAFQYIIKKYSNEKEIDENGLEKGLDGDNLTDSQKRKLTEELFFGFDIDQTMIRIGMMNLMMHGIVKPNLIHLDTLSDEYEKYVSGNISENSSSGKYKYILANPPFTGRINSQTVSENLNRAYPPKFDKEGNRAKQTVQSELLFLERIVFMLEPQGRAAVIVPEGVLFNSGKSHRETRKILMYDCDLQGVISLPEGVFQPYTGVKTSILIFKKRELRSNIPQSINIWFYELKSDGYSLDSNRKRLKESPLPIAINEWRERDKKNQTNRKLQYFSIPFDEIEKKDYELNINLYKEFVYEAQSYRKPDVILKQLTDLENEILKGLNDLKINP